MKEKIILQDLKKSGEIKNIEGMSRFGIKAENNYGNSVTYLRAYAKKLGKNHELAVKLWKTGIRDARMVAVCIQDPKTVTESQIDLWVKDLDSWDICDHCCGTLIDKTHFVYKKMNEYSKEDKEFVKRAGFAIGAWAAVHNKKDSDKIFEDFLQVIKEESTDERNYVKKAVNWALRNIGKRNKNINKKAIKVAKEIQKIDSKSARWIANDAIRELSSEKIQNRFK
jgi:3-methyladenine DNA glycosylase AlkD